MFLRGLCAVALRVFCLQTVLLKPASICSCLLQETASRKKELIKNEFSEIKAVIEERENEIMKAISEEEKRVWNKFDYIYSGMGNKKNEIQSLKDQIEMALTESDDVLFLKVMCNLNVNPVIHSRMQNEVVVVLFSRDFQSNGSAVVCKNLPSKDVLISTQISVKEC